jgi:hypothetical protein
LDVNRVHVHISTVTMPREVPAQASSLGESIGRELAALLNPGEQRAHATAPQRDISAPPSIGNAIARAIAGRLR